MLQIQVPKYMTVTDSFDVINSPGFTLKLEHSLLAISKWESRFKKPYLEQQAFTYEEFIYYVECMTLNPLELPEDAYGYLTIDNAKEIQSYIESYPSATTIKRNEDKKVGKKRMITSELLYAYMAQARIPYSAETWHIRRLLNVIEIISIDNQPKKKVPKSETLNKYRAMNRARRKPRR